jgi:hypothetical protein
LIATLALAATVAGQSVSLKGVKRVTIAAQGNVKISGESRGDLSSSAPFAAHRTKALLKVSLDPGEAEIRLPRKMHEVVLDNPAGEAEVYELEGYVTIRASRRIVANNAGSTTRIDTRGGEIRVGRAGHITCRSGGGAISIDRADRVDAESRGGDITIGASTGAVAARTLGGNIRVGRATTATLETGGGSIEASNVGSAVLRAVAGGIRIKGAGSAVASTGRGTILADFAGGADWRPSQLSTTWGDIIVSIPSNLALTVEAHIPDPSLPGRIKSEFPEIREGGRRAEGKLNGGGAPLKLTGGGNIWLRRKDIEE